MRQLRSILTIVSAGAILLSALLCVASLGMWVRSYFHDEMLAHRTLVTFPDSADPDFSATEVDCCWVWPVGPGRNLLSTASRFFARLGVPLLGPKLVIPGLGFDWYSHEMEWGFILPHWFVSLLTAIPITTWPIRRRRRFPAGLCQMCGYDLRETLERCPECGAAAETAG